MEIVTLAGILASIFTGISLLPQLIKTVREKKVNGVSPFMLACLFVGLSLWIVYGCLKNDWIIIISNGFALGINIAIISLGFYYRTNKKRDML